MRSRGYTLVKSDYYSGNSYEYWWNAGSETCIQARATDGKYETLAKTSRTDCNQYYRKENDNDAGDAIAIGAAALIGAVALAHNSQERDEKYGKDQKSVADFDRGYRDGLYHEAYHNYQNTTAYSDGYSAGRREREEQTRHQPRSGGYGGYHPYVYVDDLVGARASSADSELRARGFRDTGGYKQDGKSFVMWHNRNTRQCVQAVTRDGKIKRIEGIDEGNCL